MNKILLLIGSVAILIGIYIFFRPQSNSSDSIPKENTASVSPTQPKEKTFTLMIEENVPDEKKQLPTFTAIQGETVTIKVRSEVSDELHVHGYDKSVEIKGNNTPVTLTLVANLAGRFPIELEAASREVAALEVQPK